MSQDYINYARDKARAERELGIEHWVHISFEYRPAVGERVVLHRIDMPRTMLDRWRWLIEWRKAKLICQHPRKGVTVYHSFYDKRSGLDTGFGSLLSRLSSAKAQVTKVERAIGEYVEFNKQNNLFFCPQTDEQLKKAYTKLEQKRSNIKKMHTLLETEVATHRNGGVA